jgi:hypothetical protein
VACLSQFTNIEWIHLAPYFSGILDLGWLDASVPGGVEIRGPPVTETPEPLPIEAQHNCLPVSKMLEMLEAISFNAPIKTLIITHWLMHDSIITPRHVGRCYCSSDRTNSEMTQTEWLLVQQNWILTADELIDWNVNVNK